MAQSKIEISPNNVADGVSPAEVTVELKDWRAQGVAGVVLNLSVSGSDNVVVPCPPTDSNGRARCRVYSTRAERKRITAIGILTLSGETLFRPVRPSRSAVGIVSSGSIVQIPSGQKIISTSGIVESDTALRDTSMALRVQTSVLGSIISD